MNENLQIEASVSDQLDFILSGSEDSNVYLCSCICDQRPHAAQVSSNPFHKDDRIKSYEYFAPFGDNELQRIQVPVAIFAPSETVKLQQMKYHRLPNYKNGHPSVQHIIVTCSTDGRLRVFINEKSSDFS